MFFSPTTEPISTKLGTKHPWVQGIPVSSNEGLRPFPREIAKSDEEPFNSHKVDNVFFPL